MRDLIEMLRYDLRDFQIFLAREQVTNIKRLRLFFCLISLDVFEKAPMPISLKEDKALTVLIDLELLLYEVRRLLSSAFSMPLTSPPPYRYNSAS